MGIEYGPKSKTGRKISSGAKFWISAAFLAIIIINLQLNQAKIIQNFDQKFLLVRQWLKIPISLNVSNAENLARMRIVVEIQVVRPFSKFRADERKIEKQQSKLIGRNDFDYHWALKFFFWNAKNRFFWEPKKIRQQSNTNSNIILFIRAGIFY